MDKLDALFEKQEQLNARILGADAQKILQNAPEEWLLKFARALQQEVAELVDCVPWKWWAHYQKSDLAHDKVELVDILHFAICLAQTLGMSAEDLFDTYMKKNAVNFQRQDDGYSEKGRA